MCGSSHITPKFVTQVEYSDILISGRPQDDGGTEGLCSPSRQLEIAVVRLQKDIDDYRTELELTRKQTPAVAPRPPRRSGFTSMPVPRFSGKSNWEKYRQVFEAIVCSNGWDDVTAALQLLSHLDGDALNVALLVPESRRVVPGFLIKSLSDHYSSPGHLAEYKRTRDLPAPESEVDVSDSESEVDYIEPDLVPFQITTTAVELLCPPVVTQTRPMEGCDPASPLRLRECLTCRWLSQIQCECLSCR